MSDNTEIGWTDATWNPVVGCSRVSEGCTRCYAERFVHRFAGPGQRWDGLTKSTPSGPRWTGEARLMPERLDQPLRWKRPRRIFVNSMSDLFHETLSNEDIAAVFGVMGEASQHTFQVLTKRPARMLEWFKWAADLPAVDHRNGDGSAPTIGYLFEHARRATSGAANGFMTFFPPWPLPNVWLGVSVENQAAADERIPLLLETPGAVHFLSCEPLLGPVDLSRLLGRGIACSCKADNHPPADQCGGGWIRCNPGTRMVRWVIAGGESGPGARPMHPDWARSLRDQCAAAGTAFFFKQWGEWAPNCLCNLDKGSEAACKTTIDRPQPGRPGCMFRCGKHAAGRLLDGREHSEFPGGAS